MKKNISILVIVALVAVVYSCKKNAQQLGGTVYLDLPATPYVYNPQPSFSFFPYDSSINHKATLGRVLFYDTHLSLNNAVSCGSCHKQALGFSDNVALSAGYQGMLTKRNSKSISNITGDSLDFADINNNHNQLPLFWDGRVMVLQDLISHPVTNHVEMGISDFSVLPPKLSALPYYSQLFVNAYGDGSITTDRVAECISMFLVSIQSRTTRFDDFMKYENSNGNGNNFNFVATANPVLSQLETQGYNLFFSTYNCGNCHHLNTSSAYTMENFNDIGLDKNYKDMGLGTISGNSFDNGKFKVPSLRNVALSAPYMHDGRYQTLGDVIDHYSHNIQPSPNLDFQLQDSLGHPKQMNIPDADKQALIAFLNTLTDYQLVTDPKFSNPFKVK